MAVRSSLHLLVLITVLVAEDVSCTVNGTVDTAVLQERSPALSGVHDKEEGGPPRHKEPHTSASSSFYDYGGGLYDYGQGHGQGQGQGHGELYHGDLAGHALDDGHRGKYSSRELAMSFLAYLAVLSILQGGLIALTRSNTVVGLVSTRRRRDTPSSPLLLRVHTIGPPLQAPEEREWAKDVQCMQTSVCDINGKLARELGSAGRLLGRYIGAWASRSLEPAWRKLLEDAGRAGRRGQDCRLLFPACRGHGRP